MNPLHLSLLATVGVWLSFPATVRATQADPRPPVVLPPVAMLDAPVTQVSAGSSHVCVLTAGGAVRCWGDNTNGKLGDGTTTNRFTPVAVSGLSSGVVTISSGANHTCALTDTGGVKCWGANIAGGLGDGTTTESHVPIDVVGLTSGMVGISAGSNYTCALTASGGAKCWGANESGALGDGTTADRATPVDVSGLTSGVIMVAAGGENHTCAVTATGGAKCWGNNSGGSLGDGTTADRLTPVDVSGLTSGVKGIWTNSGHACALTTAGAVMCWGQNNFGQLGNGTVTTSSLVPVASDLTSGVSSLSIGLGQTCALTTSGAVKCWGWNDHGQLGDGTLVDRATSADVAGLSTGAAGVAAGFYHSCALLEGGEVRCWGWNAYGRLGDGTTTERKTPVAVAGHAVGVTLVAARGNHTCALTPAGGAKCWGSNDYYEVGNDSSANAIAPVDVVGLASGVFGLAGGTYHACAITASGGVKCWGWGSYGQLGDGASATSSTPVQVSTLTSGIASVVAGTYHTCALSTGGGLSCWGGNTDGQLGLGNLTSKPTPTAVPGFGSGVTAVTAGLYHTCALVSGGVKCWGDNSEGQLGGGTVGSYSTSPVDVVGPGGIGLLSGIVAIAAGGYHTCALASGGTVRCWGYNTDGELGNATNTGSGLPVDVLDSTGLSLLYGVGAIAAGEFHNCAVLSGSVKCWGWGANGQLGDDTINGSNVPVDVKGVGGVGLLSGVTALSAGGRHNCALLEGQALRCWGYGSSGQIGDAASTNRLAPVAIRSTQSIAFTPPSPLTVGTAVTLEATASSGRTVTFDTWTPSTCAIVGGQVTASARGLCGVRASQAGSGNEAPAPQRLATVAVPYQRPTITTPTNASMAPGTAILGGNVTAAGSSAITGRGVVFAPTSVNADPLIGGTGVTRVTATGATGVFTVGVTGLLPSTAYSFKAYATNAVGTSYTGVATFSELIASFTVNPVVIDPAGSATLSWSATAGATLTVDGTPVAGPTGTANVSPGATTTYTLVATDGAVTNTRTATVYVNDGAAGGSAPTVTAPLEGATVVVNGVTFSWTSVGGVSGYHLSVIDVTTGGLRFSGSLLGAASTSTLVSLPRGSFRFLVRACTGGLDAAHCGPYATRNFTVDPAAPSGAPTVTFPTEGASLLSSTQTLAWTAVTPNPLLTDLTYEVLLRDVVAGTTTLQITVPSPALSTIFTMGSAAQYELKVRACQAGCGPWSTPVTFSVTLAATPTGAPSISDCAVGGSNVLTCNWGSVTNADTYQVQVVQPPPAGPGGGALTVAAMQVSTTTVSLPVPPGSATVYVAACNGDGCGPYGTFDINAGGSSPAVPNLGTPMAGTVVAGPTVLFTWNRVPGDSGSNTRYRLYVQDLSRQSAALDVYTTSNYYSAYFKAEGARYDALVIANPGLGGEASGPAQGFNVAGSSATAPTMVSPAYNGTVSSGNVQLGWSPVPGATLYEYYVAVLGESGATARGVTTGLLTQVPLIGTGGGTVYSGIVRACPTGATCTFGSDAGWGPWSNAEGGPGVTNFTVVP